jgi:hypothetical protein
VCASTSDHRSPEQHNISQATEKQRKSLRNHGDNILTVKKREKKLKTQEKERGEKKNIL